MEKIKIHDKTFRKLIPYDEITVNIDKVAEKLNRDLKDCPEPPIILSVLNGSFMFATELVKRLEVQCEIMFIRLASYEGTSSTGKVREIIGLNKDVAGRTIVIVEDIVDTGKTIEILNEMLLKAGAEDIKVCTLFFKPESYSKNVFIDYPAMKIPNDFIVGFGLDYNQLGRQYKDIYVIDEE